MTAKQIEQLKLNARAMLSRGNFPEAKALYEKVTNAIPGDYDAWFMLGAINGHLGRLKEAADCCEQAVLLRPANPDALFNLAQVCIRLNDFPRAEAALTACVKSKPDYVEAYNNLGYALHEQGKLDEARAAYQQALDIRPDLSGTRFLLAAIGGRETPPRAPDEYVRGLFDGFAGHFEEALVSRLQYATPAIMGQMVKTLLAPRTECLDILDIGCGTGLCGMEFNGMVNRLTGIDLSPNMIEAARAKGVYSELLVGDVTECMNTLAGQFDVILSGDVFVYIGELEPVFEACRRLMKGEGLFAFSLEAADDADDYILRETNRYAHSMKYIDSLASRYGFSIADFKQLNIRLQKGTPVPGYLYVLKQMPA